MVNQQNVYVEAEIGMKIREYKLIRTEDNHPMLKICKEMEYCTDIFNSSYDIATLMVELYSMNELFIEYSYVLAFDCSNRILGIVELSHLSDVETQIPIREMVISLLLMGVNNFVLVHNHPNNYLGYSVDDALDIKTPDKLTVNAKLTDDKIAYKSIVTLKVPLENGKDIYMTDYASAGKLWTDESKMAVWIRTNHKKGE